MDSKLTLKLLTEEEAERHPKAKLFVRTLGLAQPILQNVIDFVLGLQDQVLCDKMICENKFE